MKIEELNLSGFDLFVELTLHPCILLDDGSVERVSGGGSCDFYSIYARNEKGEGEWIMDIEDREDAQTMKEFLESLIIAYRR